jgi:hypothetical protein
MVGIQPYRQRLLALGVGHVDSRVGNVASLLDGVSLSDTGSVLVEYYVLVVLNELESASS